MERSQAVMMAAEHLHATETAIDGAYGNVADLAGRLVRLRADAHLSPTVGHEALHEVTAALSAIGDAQAAMARAHGKLKVTQIKIGCRTVATGGGDKDNEDLMPKGASSPLRAVA